MHIAFDHVSKTIRRHTVLDDVCATFDSGSITGIVGPNGSGKTMLLRALCGFIRPTSGRVLVDGTPVSFNHRLPVPMGIIIEQPGFMPYETGMRNLEYLAGINRDFDPVETERLLALFGLREAADRKVRSYSLGMRQKLAIVQALMEHQPVIALDEPTNGLDEHSVGVFLEEMRHQRELGRTIIIASHHADELAQVTDRVCRMRDGRLSG